MSHSDDHSADTVYLCPSDRAARGWRRHLVARGDQFLDCVATETWLAAMWERAALFGFIADAPALLPQEAQRALWYRLASEHSGLLASECAGAVALIEEAWLLAERHQLPRPALPTTTQAVDDNVAWFASMRVSARRWLASNRALTHAELPDRLAATFPAWRSLLPAHIRLTPSFATDPALARLWQRIAALGVDIAKVDDLPPVPEQCPAVERTHDPDHDRDCALQWAGKMLASRPGEDVTLIVPGLASERESWRRDLRTHCNVDWWQAPERDNDSFNLSLGQSLAAYPAVRTLLVLLAATVRPVAVESLAQALTHPRWGNAAAMVHSVHRRLQEHIDHGIADALLNGWPLTPAAQSLLHGLTSEQKRRRRRSEHRQSIDAFVVALTAQAQIPRSDLFQLDEAWLLLLQRWEHLDRWFPALDWSQALSELTRAADDAVFQPKAGKARLHVIGLLESAGVPLSCARLVGMSDTVLPEAFSPNPLLPRSWQSAQQVGLGARTEVLARSARLMHNWRALIGDLSISCPQRNDDGEVGLSPMLHGWPTVTAAARQPASHNVASLATMNDELLPSANERDSLVRPLSASRLREQAQCPRRAAAMRLGLQPWPTLAVGISPIVRGNLVHGVLAGYGMARMAGADARAAAIARLDALIDDERKVRPTIAEAVWHTERTRSQKLLDRVIERDQRRGDFTIVAVERPVAAVVAGQRFEGKLDRIDDDGAMRVIFDYKTGKVTRNDWVLEKNSGRLADPQLPLYALMHDVERAAAGAQWPAVRGVAWFTVNDDSVDCIGVGDDDDLLPKRKRSADDGLDQWDNALNVWRGAIGDLVDEWQRGVAHVAPIKGELTCRTCEYGAFCRERWSLSGSDDAEGGAAALTDADGDSDER